MLIGMFVLAALQLFGGSGSNSTDYLLFNLLLFIVYFGVFPFLYEYLQLMRFQMQVNGFLQQLNATITNGISQFMGAVNQMGSKNGSSIDGEKVKNELRNLMDLVVIDPTNIETEGLVRKLKYLINMYSDRLEGDVRMIMPGLDKPMVQNMANAVEVLRNLNYIYKVVDHYYKLSSKYKSYYLLYQLTFMLPFLKEAVNALSNSITSFVKGQPIGDAAGPLTIYRFMNSCQGKSSIDNVIPDTYIGQCLYNERKIYLMKAQGPGGTVGHLDDAVNYLLETLNVKPRLVITIDAALKLEGEKTGTITDGLGVAMGGIGAEKFNIETTVSKHNIPLYAILIKMSEMEALNTMTKQIDDSVNSAVDRLKKIIEIYTSQGDEVLVIGVGNTIGVAQ